MASSQPIPDSSSNTTSLLPSTGPIHLPDPRLSRTRMSHNMNPSDQNPVRRNGTNAETDWDMIEDTFTAHRPPQYRTQGNSLPNTGPDAVPRTVNTAGMQFFMRDRFGVDPRYAGSHTDSTVTITADDAVATAAAALPRTLSPVPTLSRGPRNHVLWHATRDYDGTLQPLTELAIAALNHGFSEAYTGDVSQWVHGQRSSGLEEAMTVDVSMFDVRSIATTRTDSSAGSSWTVLSSTHDNIPSQMDDVLPYVGSEFDDVPACIDPDIMDEDCT